jgi:hypothetical protein
MLADRLQGGVDEPVRFRALLGQGCLGGSARLFLALPVGVYHRFLAAPGVGNSCPVTDLASGPRGSAPPSQRRPGARPARIRILNQQANGRGAQARRGLRTRPPRTAALLSQAPRAGQRTTTS